MLRTRVLTAAALLAGFAGAVYFLDRLQFAALIGLVIAIAAHEWARLSGLRGAPRWSYAAGCVLLYAALVWMVEQQSGPSWLGPAVFIAASVFWLVVVPAWFWAGVGARGRILLPPAGLIVLLPTALSLVTLSGAQMLAVFGLIWVSDTAAYFVGRAWGRRKLASSISPGKTWEGVAGAVIATQIYAIIVSGLSSADSGPPLVAYLGGAALLCGLGILGDLFESAVKRQAAVKDSGTLLPGHGGILDRIDSATASLPSAALLIHWTAIA